jgi:hypothetical protein
MADRQKKLLAVAGLALYFMVCFLWLMRVHEENSLHPSHMRKDAQGNPIKDAKGNFVYDDDVPH